MCVISWQGSPGGVRSVCECVWGLFGWPSLCGSVPGSKVEERHHHPPPLHPPLSICPFYFSPSSVVLRAAPRHKPVLFLPLCGGGGGEKMERAMPLNRTWGWAWSPPLTPATAYRVTAAPAPPPGPMNSVSIFCLFYFYWFKWKRWKTKGRRQGMSACLLSGLFCMNERAMGRVMCAGQPLGFCLTFVFFNAFSFFF